MTSKIINIIGVIILVIVAGNFYQGCTRGDSEKYLNQMIESKEQEIDGLKKGYASIVEREQELLVEIGQLKDRVQALRLDISEGDARIEEVRNELIEIDSAIAIIHDHTTRSVSRGISLLGDTGGGAEPGDD